MNNDTFLPDGYEIPCCPYLAGYEQEERGDRKHYIRANVTMSPDMLRHLKTIGARLQALGAKDTDVSSLVRSACKDFLSKMEDILPDPNDLNANKGWR